MSQYNARLKQIVAAQNVVNELFRQFEEAQYAFTEEWAEYIPSNPEHEGFSATIEDVYDGQKLVMVDYLAGLVYPFEVVGSISFQLLSSEQFFVEDKRGTKRTLHTIGVLPEYAEGGDEIWLPGRITVIDEPGSLDYLAEFLYEQDLEEAVKTAESVTEYLQRTYLGDVPPFLSSEGVSLWHDD